MQNLTTFFGKGRFFVTISLIFKILNEKDGVLEFFFEQRIKKKSYFQCFVNEWRKYLRKLTFAAILRFKDFNWYYKLVISFFTTFKDFGAHLSNISWILVKASWTSLPPDALEGIFEFIRVIGDFKNPRNKHFDFSSSLTRFHINLRFFLNSYSWLGYLKTLLSFSNSIQAMFWIRS